MQIHAMVLIPLQGSANVFARGLHFRVRTRWPFFQGPFTRRTILHKPQHDDHGNTMITSCRPTHHPLPRPPMLPRSLHRRGHIANVSGNSWHQPASGGDAYRRQFNSVFRRRTSSNFFTPRIIVEVFVSTPQTIGHPHTSSANPRRELWPPPTINSEGANRCPKSVFSCSNNQLQKKGQQFILLHLIFLSCGVVSRRQIPHPTVSSALHNRTKIEGRGVVAIGEVPLLFTAIDIL